MALFSVLMNHQIRIIQIFNNSPQVWLCTLICLLAGNEERVVPILFKIYFFNPSPWAQFNICKMRPIVGITDTVMLFLFSLFVCFFSGYRKKVPGSFPLLVCFFVFLMESSPLVVSHSQTLCTLEGWRCIPALCALLAFFVAALVFGYVWTLVCVCESVYIHVCWKCESCESSRCLELYHPELNQLICIVNSNSWNTSYCFNYIQTNICPHLHPHPLLLMVSLCL